MANKAKATAKQKAQADAEFFAAAGISFRPSWKQHLAWQALEDDTTEEVMSPGGINRCRRAYTTADIRFIQTHYKDCTSTELAKQLGRTVGSIKNFIYQRPELRKRAKAAT